MATITLRPNGDGTLGTWTRFAASGTWAARIVDDPDSNDGDTSYVQGPNVADSSMFVTLDDMPANFDPDGVTAIEIKASAKKIEGGVSQAVDTVDLYLQLFRLNETTVISAESAVSNVTGTASYTLFTRSVALSGTHSKTDWNGARLRIRQDYTVQQMPDTTAQIRVTAVEVTVTYTPLSGAVTAGLGLGASFSPLLTSSADCSANLVLGIATDAEITEGPAAEVGDFSANLALGSTFRGALSVLAGYHSLYRYWIGGGGAVLQAAVPGEETGDVSAGLSLGASFSGRADDVAATDANLGLGSSFSGIADAVAAIEANLEAAALFDALTAATSAIESGLALGEAWAIELATLASVDANLGLGFTPDATAQDLAALAANLGLGFSASPLSTEAANLSANLTLGVSIQAETEGAQVADISGDLGLGAAFDSQADALAETAAALGLGGSFGAQASDLAAIQSDLVLAAIFDALTSGAETADFSANLGFGADFAAALETIAELSANIELSGTFAGQTVASSSVSEGIGLGAAFTAESTSASTSGISENIVLSASFSALADASDAITAGLGLGAEFRLPAEARRISATVVIAARIAGRAHLRAKMSATETTITPKISGTPELIN